MMDVAYAPKMWMRSQYYGADEFFEIQGDEGMIWVTRCTGEMLDLPPVMLYRGARGRADHDRVTTGSTPTGAPASPARRPTSSMPSWPAPPPDLTADEAVKVLQLCFAVYEAGNTGQKVDPRTMDASVTPTGWAEW